MNNLLTQAFARGKNIPKVKTPSNGPPPIPNTLRAI